MQLGDDLGLDLQELGEQELPEQRVVPIPPTVTVHRHQEQAARLQLPQPGLGAWLAENRVAQRTGQLVEHRRTSQEPLDVLGQLHQRLAVQVVGHIPVVTGDRHLTSGVPGDQCGQVEPGRPPLGPRGHGRGHARR